MASPFPGMNPYLEQDDAWHDFHERFMPAAAEAISAQVDPRYIVKIDEHVYIHEMPNGDRRFLGREDVSVAHPDTESVAHAEPASATAPVQVLLPMIDTERHAYLEIRDRRQRQLVTVIELLSPSNKRPGSDREQYLAKRAEVLASATHFVELDLLRGGARMPLEDLPACDYCALVSRAEDRPQAGLWPVSLREPLPSIPVPLRAPDLPATLDLQSLLHRIYEAARYASYIYEGDPDPPLSSEERRWAQQWLVAI